MEECSCLPNWLLVAWVNSLIKSSAFTQKKCSVAEVWRLLVANTSPAWKSSTALSVTFNALFIGKLKYSARWLYCSYVILRILSRFYDLRNFTAGRGWGLPFWWSAELLRIQCSCWAPGKQKMMVIILSAMSESWLSYETFFFLNILPYKMLVSSSKSCGFSLAAVWCRTGVTIKKSFFFSHSAILQNAFTLNKLCRLFLHRSITC